LEKKNSGGVLMGTIKESLDWQTILKNAKYNLFASSYRSIFRGKCGIANRSSSTLIKGDYELRSYYNNDEYFFYLNLHRLDHWIRLNPDAINILRNVFVKYMEWEEKASTEKIKLEKEIPGSTIIAHVAWKEMTVKDLCLGEGLVITCTFFSQTETRHQLIISTNEVGAINSRWGKIKLEGIYLDKEGVAGLQNAISEQNLASEDKKIREEVEKLERSAAAKESFT
jgi:hypothetical protein